MSSCKVREKSFISQNHKLPRHELVVPIFVIGGKVTLGILGDHPSLSDLQGGDLKHIVDFRSVYSTVLAKWLNANPEVILQGKYEQMAFL